MPVAGSITHLAGVRLAVQRVKPNAPIRSAQLAMQARAIPPRHGARCSSLLAPAATAKHVSRFSHAATSPSIVPTVSSRNAAQVARRGPAIADRAWRKH